MVPESSPEPSGRFSSIRQVACTNPRWVWVSLKNGGFVQRYRFSDAEYLNRFTRTDNGWRWTITEQTKGKPDSVFADYTLRRSASCRGVQFEY